jgi:hypothetical protein
MPSSPGHTISNDFIFFGHTDYGGDGGEGSLVYPENEERYNENFRKYLDNNNITNPELNDINKFQEQEIVKFITRHPFRWIGLQFKKFTHTFGVVPESSSFRVLYTGILKENLWLTSIIVTAPVASFLLLFIQLFNINLLKKPGEGSASDKRGLQVKYIYLLLLLYYIVAICFFGHYQERYRMPVMVIFLLPLTAIFISGFRLSQYLRRPDCYFRQALTVVVLTIWILQASAATANKKRLNNAILNAKELIEKERGNTN